MDYRKWLLGHLRDSAERCVGYLNAALDENPETFLVALKDVVDARGGMSKTAQRAKLHRVSLHAALSKGGNPRMSSLERILASLGFQLAIVRCIPSKRKRRSA